MGNTIYKDGALQLDHQTGQPYFRHTTDNLGSKVVGIGSKPNPYVGLESFGMDDSSRFFGREDEVDRLWTSFETLHRRPGANPVRMLPIIGASGCGKSSIVRAGLIPQLLRKPISTSTSPRVVVCTPGAHPLESLAAVLARVQNTDERPSHEIEAEIESRLQRSIDEGTFDGLRRFADGLPNISMSPIIIFVDQFEELYSLCDDEEERHSFVSLLYVAAADKKINVSVLFTMRHDFIDATAHHESFNKVISIQGEIVPAMTRQELERAIVLPAEKAGYQIDSSTVRLLINESEGRIGALPLLQFALSRIWDELQNGRSPSDTLDGLGGVGGALASEASRLFRSIPEDDKRIAKRAFLSLIQLGDGVKDSRRRVMLSELASEDESRQAVLDVLRVFAQPDNRLLTLSRNNDDDTEVEITHEALLDHWEELAEWVNSNRDKIRLHRRLAASAVRWKNRGRTSGDLWRSTDLELVRSQLVGPDSDLTKTESDFVDQSIRRALIDRAWKVAASVLVPIVITSLFLAIETVGKRSNELQRSRLDNLGNRLILYSDNESYQSDAIEIVDDILELTNKKSLPFPNEVLRGISETTNSLSRFRKVPAHSSRVTDSVFISEDKFISIGSDGLINLVSVLNSEVKNTIIVEGPTDVLLIGGDQLQSVTEVRPIALNKIVLSPVADEFAVGGQDGLIRIYAISDFRLIRELPGEPNQAIHDLSYSHDGKTLVGGTSDGIITFWNLTSGEITRRIDFSSSNRSLRIASFLPNQNNVIAVVGGSVSTIDVADNFRWRSTEVTEQRIRSADISSDGKFVILARSGGPATVFDIERRTFVSELIGHSEEIEEAIFVSDNEKVVTASHDGSVRVWEVQSGKLLRVMTGAGSFWSLAEVKGRGLVVAVGGIGQFGARFSGRATQGVVRVLHFNSGEVLDEILLHGDRVDIVEVSPKRGKIITGDHSGLIGVWTLDDKYSIHEIRSGETFLHHASISPDGSKIVGINSDQEIVFFDRKADTNLQTRRGHSEWVEGVKFAPFDNLISTWDRAGRVNLWDADTKSLQYEINGHRGAVLDLAFCSVQPYFATVGSDSYARIWSSSSGQLVSEFIHDADSIFSVDMSKDCKSLITLDQNGALTSWSTNSGVQEWSQRYPGYGSVRYSPANDTALIVGESSHPQIINSKTGESIHGLIGHRDLIAAHDWSPDGKQIVTGSFDSSVIVWDSSTGEELWRQNHDGWVKDVEFDPNGKFIASASADRTARVWGALSGDLVFNLGHQSEVESVSFDHLQGLLVTSGVAAKAIQVFNVSDRGVVSQYCDVITRVRSTGNSSPTCEGR